MEDHAESIKLYPSKLKTVGYLIIFLIFLVLGILFIMNTGEFTAWIVAAFGLLGGLVFIVQLIPESTYLLITPSGLTVKSLFRGNTYKWQDIKEFGVGAIPAGPTLRKMVLFNFEDSYKKQATARALSKGISGYDGGLPDTYGKKPEELAALLNSKLQKYK